MAKPSTQRPDPNQWRSRPWLSLALRLFVYLVPAALGVLTVAALGAVLRPPPELPQLLLWWTLLSLAGFAVLLLAERGTRHLLPLAALLRLSLIFPDRAPARFAVARRAARPKQVLRQLEEVDDGGRRPEARAAQTVLELSLALSVHDRGTRGHSERVQVLTDMITKELGLPEPDRARLRWAALLHDIGKLKVPAKVLNKPAKPTPREWVLLRRHPAEGERIVAPLLPWLGKWGDAVVQHHEQYDGSGYPRGLRGTGISLGARIVSVADVFEVITAPRPYRRPVSVAKARSELVRVSGSQLDPAMVRAFLNVAVGDLWPVVGMGSLLCQLPLVARAVAALGRLLPGLGGSTAAAGAAGGLLLATFGHPADIRPAPQRPAPTASAHRGLAPQPALDPDPTAPAASGQVISEPSRAPSLTPAAAPTATAAPTPTAAPPAPATPRPAPAAPPAPPPTPAPLRAPAPQLLKQLGQLLERLGL